MAADGTFSVDPAKVKPAQPEVSVRQDHDRELAAEEHAGPCPERGRAAAESADRTVRDHPWESVAIAAGLGFLLGMLTARR